MSGPACLHQRDQKIERPRCDVDGDTAFREPAIGDIERVLAEFVPFRGDHADCLRILAKPSELRGRDAASLTNEGGSPMAEGLQREITALEELAVFATGRVYMSAVAFSTSQTV